MPSVSDRLLRIAAKIEKVSASQPVIMYHGTSPKNLSSIMSQGLIPDPKQRAWYTDPDASWYKPSRQSVGGIYLTDNLMTAVGSVSNGPRRERPGTAGVVIVEMQPNNMVGDEDDFSSFSDLTASGYNVGEQHAAQMYFDWLNNGDAATYYNEAKQSYIDKNVTFYNYLAEQSEPGKPMHPELQNRLRQILDKGFIFALKRKCAYVDDYTWRRAWESMRTDREAQTPVRPEKAQVEQSFLQYMDVVTRAMKASASSSHKINRTGRTLNPIRFSGQSKIVAVLEIGNSYEQTKADGFTSIKVVYPASWEEIPANAKDNFIRQYESRFGGEYRFV